MSGGLLVLALVGAAVFVAFGVQLTARQLQRFPVDSRKVGPLIDTTRRTSWVVRPVELEQLNAIVTESLSSQAVARAKLQPILDELASSSPPVSRSAAGPQRERATGRRGRTRRLEERLSDLELAWGLSPPT